ncbi:MAG: YceI family protein [Bacteroidia bacterium]
MKAIKNIAVCAGIIISMAFTTPDNYTLAKDYTVTIHGTSNHDDWDETVGVVTGGGLVNINKDGSFDLNAIHLKMEVKSIKSKSSIMNSKTYTALKANEDPEITFTLTSPVKAIKASAAGTMVSAGGTLYIGGVSKQVVMQVKVRMLTNEKLEFEGSHAIKMSEYGIKAPTALLGMLKTGDEITLNFKTNFIK